MSRWKTWMPLFVWIALILWVASKPKTTFFPKDVKTILGLPREYFQYPYHFGVFFILAVLFRRCFSQSAKGREGWRCAIFSLFGCAAVSAASEFIQFYVPSRSPAVRDLAVDQSGAVFALAVIRQISEKIFRFRQ